MNSVWGTVCDTNFGSRDAQVACGQLGYDDQGIFSLLFSSVFFIHILFISYVLSLYHKYGHLKTFLCDFHKLLK